MSKKVENPVIPTPVVETPAVAAPVVEAAAAKEDISLMDGAVSKEKAVIEAENKRILEADEKTLSAEDKVKKVEIVKAKEEAEKAAKANVVPDKYEFKVPEGMTIDQEYADKASVIMKKHNITQAAATELGEMAAAQIAKNIIAKEAQDKANFDNFVADLKKETMKELGANAQKELSFAAKSRDRLASPGLIDKLNKSGLANDVDVIKHFIKIGKAISEGKLVEGKPAGAGEKDLLATLYPKTTVSK